MQTDYRTIRVLLAAVVLAVAPSTTGRAADDAPAAPKLAAPTVDVTVTDWVVLLADATNPTLNAKPLFPDTLPQFCESLRTTAPADQAGAAGPTPLGVIRLLSAGKLDKTQRVDVQLGIKEGRAMANWPRATVRSSGLLWQDLGLDPAAGEPRRLPEGSWLAPLRESGLPLVAKGIREPLLLYDVALQYPMALKVSGGKESKYTVACGMSAPLRNFTLYLPAGEKSWRAASLDKLSKTADFPSGPAPKPTEQDRDTTKAEAAVAANAATTQILTTMINGRVMKRAVIGGPTATPPPPDGAAAPAVAMPSDLKLAGVEMALGAARAESEALAPWKTKLVDAGLAKCDQDTILKILARYALDSHRLTAVYQLDPAEQERLMPLEIVPQPKKISRIALVIVRGIDPALDEELAGWIIKLGDPSWKVREQASQEIRKLGATAKQRLEKASADKDAEVAHRAEQLLWELSRGPGDESGPSTFSGGQAIAVPASSF